MGNAIKYLVPIDEETRMLERQNMQLSNRLDRLDHWIRHVVQREQDTKRVEERFKMECRDKAEADARKDKELGEREEQIVQREGDVMREEKRLKEKEEQVKADREEIERERSVLQQEREELAEDVMREEKRLEEKEEQVKADREEIERERSVKREKCNTARERGIGLRRIVKNEGGKKIAT